MAEAKESSAKPGGKKLVIILISVVAVLGAAAGWFLTRPKSAPAQEVTNVADPESHGTAAEKPKETPKEKPKPNYQREERQLLPGEIPGGGIVVPLTRDAIAFHRFKIRGATETCCIMIAELDRIAEKLTQVAEADRIVVNLSESNGKGIVVMEIGMHVRHEDTIRLINERKHLIFDRISTIVSKKTQAEANRGEFQNKIEKELLIEINSILGGRPVSKLVFFRFRLS